MAHLDLVADILQRVADRGIPLRPEDLEEIEQEVRADWGGEEYYVEKVGEGGRMRILRRNRDICEAAAKGAPNDYLSLRYNLTERRIRQIIAVGNVLGK